MTEQINNSKRIAKNTLMLYLRLLLILPTTLYTSREILEVLGVVDYGIYNIVGGIVAMFAMISGSMSGAISRFITLELGKGNQEKLNIIFSTSIIIQLIIGGILVILVDTIGIWFLTNKLVIPPDRILAAKWVLQFSLITLIINLISLPYNAAIIAHERMKAFAFISILEAVGKLGIAFFISVSPIDNLIFYAILMTLLSLGLRFFYSIYSRKHFEECKFRWVFNKQIFKEIFNFSLWNFIGATSNTLREQGGSIILNMLAGGPVINAARGISTQVNSAINQFVSNFMMAINPQITKSYARGDYKYMKMLIFQGARLSFYMLLILSLPIIVSTSYVLTLWLNNFPEYTVEFVQLTLVFGMCEALSNPLLTAIFATGNVKKYQITFGVLNLFNLPLSYVFLKIGYAPLIVLVVAIFISMCCLILRLYTLRSFIGLSIRAYFKKVYFNIVIVTIVSAVIPCLSRIFIEDNLIGFIIVSLICVVSTLASIYVIGCNSKEREYVKQKIVMLKLKLINK